MRKDYSEQDYQKDRAFVEAVDSLSEQYREALLDEYNLSLTDNMERTNLLKIKLKGLTGQGGVFLEFDKDDIKPARISQSFVNTYNQSKKNIASYKGHIKQQKEHEQVKSTVEPVYESLDHIFWQYDKVDLEMQNANLFTDQAGLASKKKDLDSRIKQTLESCSPEQLDALKQRVGQDKWRKYCA
ncbi:hypothetical protein GOV06_03905 [Candidatus Woesearchaeota archaeon]|nr:hypothetical protein [Candidatus Woesearchaeota archaeon]